MKKFIIPVVTVVFIMTAGFWFPTINQAKAQSQTQFQSQSLIKQLNLLQNLMKQVQALQAQINQITNSKNFSTIQKDFTQQAQKSVIQKRKTNVNISKGYVSLNELSGNEKVSCILPKKIKRGDKNNSVFLLQKTLHDSGYYPEGYITGYYGKLTQKAVDRFKRANPNKSLNSLIRGAYRECDDIRIDRDNKKPSITVLSPNGGEQFVIGETYTIKWKSSNIDKVYIGLVNYDAPEECLLNDGKPVSAENNIYTFRLKTCLSYPGMGEKTEVNINEGKNYKIYIYDLNIATVKDFSDGYFTITGNNNDVPTISGVSGPQSLNVNQTGTWTVKASDSSGGNLTYSVDWGDTMSYGTAYKEEKLLSSQQSATFTHNYSRAGTYTPTFTVTNSSGQSARTSLSVKVESVAISQPSITVINPLAGNVFDNSGAKNSITRIKWKTKNFGNRTINIGLFDVNGKFVKSIPSSYNQYGLPNTGEYIWPYDPSIPNGKYRLYISAYVFGKAVNDYGTFSGYFTLVGNDKLNTAPTISGVSGPQSLNVNQTGTWTVKASDSSGGNLTYSVDWGDTMSYGTAYKEEKLLSSQQSATFTHNYSRAGTYTPTFTVTNNSGQSAKTSLSVRVSKIDIVNRSKKHLRGAISAAITIEEWVDYTAPFVALFNTTINKLLKNYNGRVNLVVKYFPIDLLNPLSSKISEATECASDQGDTYFWKLHDRLLNLSPSIIENLNSIKLYVANFVNNGFNINRFNQCLDNGEKTNTIANYIKEGTSKNINAVPTTYVIRKRDNVKKIVNGAVSYTSLSNTIDKLLKTNPILICEYAAPPVGCKYIEGPNYNSTTQCGLVLNCPSGNGDVLFTSDKLQASLIDILKNFENILKQMKQ